MDFSLSAEQLQMQVELDRTLARVAPMDRVRAVSERAGQLLPDIWKEVRALGLPGLLIAADHGGLGLGILDAVVAAEQLGRHAVPTPFLGTAVMAPLAIARAGTRAQQEQYLPGLADGSTIAAVGILDDEGPAFAADGNYVSGRAAFVVDSAGADFFILADPAKRLFVVERNEPGVRVTTLDAIDRTRAICAVDLENVEAVSLPVRPADAIASMRAAARVVLAADTLGAAGTMLERAVAYAGQRRQFGRLIGSFQAVKHICADMAAELEPGRALLWYAAFAQDEELEDAELTTLHAKAYLADAGRMVARKSVEVHGGIGITDVLGLHFWFKRIGWNHQVFGSPERLRAEAARLEGLAA
jgi:alkylation response protein AidB-like acyl-CoA dehydrogenase